MVGRILFLFMGFSQSADPRPFPKEHLYSVFTSKIISSWSGIGAGSCRMPFFEQCVEIAGVQDSNGFTDLLNGEICLRQLSGGLLHSDLCKIVHTGHPSCLEKT